MTLAKALAADVCLDVGEFALSCEALLLGEEQDTVLFRIFDGLLWDTSPYVEPGGSPHRPAAPPPGGSSDTASPKPRQSRRGRMNRPSEANYLTAASPHRRQRPTAPPPVSSPLLIRPPPLGSGRNSPTSPTSPPSTSPRLQARRASTGRTRRGSLGAILPPCEEDLLRLKLRRVVRLLFGEEALDPRPHTPRPPTASQCGLLLPLSIWRLSPDTASPRPSSVSTWQELDTWVDDESETLRWMVQRALSFAGRSAAARNVEILLDEGPPRNVATRDALARFMLEALDSAAGAQSRSWQPERDAAGPLLPPAQRTRAAPAATIHRTGSLQCGQRSL